MLPEKGAGYTAVTSYKEQKCNHFLLTHYVQDLPSCVTEHQMRILCYSYHACSYSHFINQQIHLIKYNSWQVSNSYMLWHWGVILRLLIWRHTDTILPVNNVAGHSFSIKHRPTWCTLHTPSGMHSDIWVYCLLYNTNSSSVDNISVYSLSYLKLTVISYLQHEISLDHAVRGRHLYVYSIQDTNGCVLVLEAAHCRIVFIPQRCNFINLCLSSLCILEF
jgi:hypothetical protein